ncbi:acid-sensing ion channel 2-like [Haliotis rufescens]|uniref:acid-sensing ion channel 2-like n=1 Tax=Haliotis rufescens TaxID=6454 RepID=UPI00201F7407|nr:acid-sensing ion channel 2-like [Haliotis rufescens]
MVSVDAKERDASTDLKFWWSLAIAAMTALLIFMLVTAMREFYTYPKMTSYSVEVMESLIFPAVTICNFSPVNISKLNIMDNQEILNFLLQSSPLYGLATETNYDSHDFFKTDLSAAWYEQVAMEKETMFILCWFNGVNYPCGPLFTPVHTATGMCYQFNVNASSPLTTTMTGSSTNLVVLVYVDQDNYVFSQEPASGVVRHVREPPLMLHDENKGFQFLSK